MLSFSLSGAGLVVLRGEDAVGFVGFLVIALPTMAFSLLETSPKGRRVACGVIDIFLSCSLFTGFGEGCGARWGDGSQLEGREVVFSRAGPGGMSSWRFFALFVPQQFARGSFVLELFRPIKSNETHKLIGHSIYEKGWGRNTKQTLFTRKRNIKIRNDAHQGTPAGRSSAPQASLGGKRRHLLLVSPPVHVGQHPWPQCAHGVDRTSRCGGSKSRGEASGRWVSCTSLKSLAQH